jgi:protein-L-isoaspartate(D-aspartate) O-methyltransferase
MRSSRLTNTTANTMADHHQDGNRSPRLRGRRWTTIGMVCAFLVCAVVIWGLVPAPNVREATEPVAESQNHQAASDVGVVARATDPDSGKAHIDPFADQRRRMVDQQIRRRGITDERVLGAMERVPRHRFVPEELQSLAYTDQPLPIGHDQTISQPYIVALMTYESRPQPQSRALDVGTGSGYQAAVLAEVCQDVYSIEIVPQLADDAAKRLASLGYGHVTVRSGDGYRGWPEHAPFDVIIVAAAPDHVPQPLVDQLATGGRLVIPVGRYFQNLLVLEKRTDGSLHRRNIAPVAFVPMTGEAQRRDLP